MRPLLTKIYYFKSYIQFKSKGKNIMFSKGGKFIRPNEITFGNNIFINSLFHISARNLSFGSNIMIGPGLVIECDNHNYQQVGQTMFEIRDHRKIGSISIENDVWIGANVVILPNVVIGEGCIVGAGSIICKSLPPYTICVGSPCKPIKRRFSSIQLEQHIALVKSSKKTKEIIEKFEMYNL
jgi:acetyltransferase-like isoleucine patch superfamily enzyme